MKLSYVFELNTTTVAQKEILFVTENIFFSFSFLCKS